jgi:hypothetical protein
MSSKGVVKFSFSALTQLSITSITLFITLSDSSFQANISVASISLKSLYISTPHSAKAFQTQIV